MENIWKGANSNYMTKMELISRYTDLARQRSELFLQSGSGWNSDIERREKAILGEMAALEAAIKLPVQEEQAIPEMLTIRKAAERTGLSYDCIRKLCLQKKITFVMVGTKYLVNFGKLVDFLNGQGTNI
ncbi:excisionase family DNA-binding protein [Enterocloster clostridioformis]|uniref:excisionase family DNA-binding protein n=1 Tax=Enterocloster clostridioformis TaxID=1531 RepID=UPI0022DFD41B|nr:excisionase family DNA-binding protein [Enterocloster clostridioformis]